MKIIQHELNMENENFLRMGVSSIQAIKVINTLKKRFNIDPVVIFEYSTIMDLSEFLEDIVEVNI